MRLTMMLAGLSLAGCAVLRSADAPVTMRLSPIFAPANNRLPGSVAVATVQARGLAGAQRYAYVDAAAPSEIRQAATFFWEEPPPRVLERSLVAGLRTRFASVSGPPLAMAADRRVAVTLIRFEEAGAGGQAEAVVAFDANVTKDGALVDSGSFCGSMPIASAAGTARAAAFEGAIGIAVGALVQRMAGESAAELKAGAGC